MCVQARAAQWEDWRQSGGGDGLVSPVSMDLRVCEVVDPPHHPLEPSQRCSAVQAIAMRCVHRCARAHAGKRESERAPTAQLADVPSRPKPAPPCPALLPRALLRQCRVVQAVAQPRAAVTQRKHAAQEHGGHSRHSTKGAARLEMWGWLWPRRVGGFASGCALREACEIVFGQDLKVRDRDIESLVREERHQRLPSQRRSVPTVPIDS